MRGMSGRAEGKVMENESHKDGDNRHNNQEPSRSGPSRKTFRCRICGQEVVALYQFQTCRSCLVESFQRLSPIIDSMRTGRNR